MRWHDKYAFTRRWKIKIRRIICSVFGHAPTFRWEEEKFYLPNLGQTSKYHFCRRCREPLPEDNTL